MTASASIAWACRLRLAAQSTDPAAFTDLTVTWRPDGARRPIGSSTPRQLTKATSPRSQPRGKTGSSRCKLGTSSSPSWIGGAQDGEDALPSRGRFGSVWRCHNPPWLAAEAGQSFTVGMVRLSSAALDDGM